MSTTIESEAAYRQANNQTLISAMASEHSDRPSDFDITVINDAERGRWTAILGAEGIGELTYRFVGGRVVLLKAWVDPAYRNHGVASELIAYALEEISHTGKKITIICPVVGTFIAGHPEYAGLIDPVHPGSGAQPQRAARSDEDEISAFEDDVQ